MNDTDDIALIKRSLDIVDHTVTLPEDQRVAYIRQQCENNEALLKQCYLLLKNDRSDESFLRDLINPKPTREKDEPSLSGEIFGVYRLNKRLGSGGMADVYSATRIDGVHDHLVALKLVRGWGNTQELVSRFQRERKILSGLKHPNIAYFLDGGVSQDGRPFYAMEYIEGEHIDKYCQQNKLSLDERLGLFIKVCEAVAFAHQQLVIHRDLKPNNILVTKQGQVKLLDFGIAKLMNNEDIETNLSVLSVPMTPRYASPEQVKRKALSTASDQYSLGVILYELLTGQSPYGLEGKNILDQVCDAEPNRPSQVVEKNKNNRQTSSRKLTGDLDVIVLKTLQKLPERRYRSVQQLADDIKCYLSKRPVIARGDSIVYLATRFVQRYRAMITVALIFLLVTFGQQFRVMYERDIAIKKGEIANQVQAFMVSLFEISDPSEARGDSITAREILDRGVEKINATLNEQPEEKSALMHTMGVVYRKLGLYQMSAKLLKQALDMRQQILSGDSLEVADSLSEYGNLLREQGLYDQVEELYLQALMIYKNELGLNHLSVADMFNVLGEVHFNKGEYDQAHEYYEKALGIKVARLGSEHPSVALTYTNLGVVYLNKGEYSRAIEQHEKAISIRINKLGKRHPELGNSYNYLGVVYMIIGEYARAIEYYEKALTIKYNALGEVHPSIAMTYNNLGIVYEYTGEYDRSIDYYEKAVLLRIDTLGEKHPSVAVTYNNLGVVYGNIGEYERVLEYYLKALPIFVDSLTENHTNVAMTYSNLAAVYKNMENYDLAIKHAEKSLSILSVVVENDHPQYGEVYATLGDIYMALATYPLASDYYNKALTLYKEKIGEDHPETLKVQEKLAKLNKLEANTH